MPFQLCQGSKVVGEYATEADALAALREHCRVEGVRVEDVSLAMNMDLWEIDGRGRRKKRWWGHELVARLRSSL
jgi:hypothetical protein